MNLVAVFGSKLSLESTIDRKTQNMGQLKEIPDSPNLTLYKLLLSLSSASSPTTLSRSIRKMFKRKMEEKEERKNPDNVC